MRALDLFCGAGGASEGLRLAGFEEIVGIDIKDQPGYPFHFHQADVVGGEVTGFFLQEFDFIWASPPCQKFTAYKRRKHHVGEFPNHIPAVREMLKESGVPYVIENVPGAPLDRPVTLCGSMFGLDVRRHRIFESSFTIEPLECGHHRQTPRFPPATNRKNLRSTVEIGVWRIPLETQRKAMGIHWMDLTELSQAVPPAYSEFIANRFIETEETK